MKRWFLGSLVGLSLGACARDSLVDSFGCPEYQLVCDGACTDVSRDSSNCGTCGSECSAGEECLAGRCREQCDERETLCADGCADILADDDNCGRCGNECDPGQSCVDGECNGMGCPRGQQRCGDECVDTTQDADHCGECFAECAAGNRCENSVCEAGCGRRTDCDGRCVNLENSEDNCGECGIRCDAGQACDNGICSGCPDGLVRCGEECVDLVTDPDHCGSCEFDCGPAELCSLGVCGCFGPNLSICGDGCADLGSDPNNCGSCGNVCFGTCLEGACCASPLAACGEECVDLLSSELNCGSCDNACGPGMSCIDGACYYVECPAGYMLCSDECVDVLSDPNNCGLCDSVCYPGYSCEAGACRANCEFPEIWCGTTCTDPETDPDNCGDCSFVCDQGLVCRDGACTDPGESCNFSKLGFPIELNGGMSVSDITADEDCNLYVGMENGGDHQGIVYKIDGASGDVQAIANFPERVRGLVYRPTDGKLYGTSLDRLVSVGTDGTEPVSFDQSVTGEFLNGMTLSPDNWAGWDGYLVVAQSTGDIVVYDPDSPSPEVFVSLGTFISDVEFSGKQLYVAAHDDSQILKVTPSGAVSTLAKLDCNPDGLAVEPGVQLFASCTVNNMGYLYTIDLDTGEYAWLASVSLSSGWAPSGLLWQNGVLFVVEENTGLNAVFL